MPKTATNVTATSCFHCGQDVADASYAQEDKAFCCAGCLAVYRILHDAQLGSYYTVSEKAGSKPTGHDPERFAYLDEPSITPRLLDYVDATRAKVTFSVPQIHCSACIWLLENLCRLETAINRSTVDFLSRRLLVEYSPENISLSRVVALLARLGYEPDIRLDRIDAPPAKSPNASLYIKIGIAGFSFANIMLFSFPEYFSRGEIGDEPLSILFRYANLLLSIPVFFYAANDYFKSAWAGIRQRTLNLDFPIALGLCALFFRSAWDIITQSGPGYFDSFTGLVLFLLAGKLFQRKTYQWLSFDRDYRAYFPIAVRRRREQQEETVAVGLVGVGDRLVIRHQELIPADGIVMDGRASIDYSFVTGETDPHSVAVGERVYAGGRQTEGSIEIEVIKSVDESYLVTLWSQTRGNTPLVSSKVEKILSTVTQGIGAYFTLGVLLIAAITAWWWLTNDPSRWVHAFTSVLLVACPCAIALSSPFVFGSAMRLFGARQLFLRHPDVVDALSRVNTIVLDKTGTLTESIDGGVPFTGTALTNDEFAMVGAVARQSTHPASRYLARLPIPGELPVVTEYAEIPGSGVLGQVGGQSIRLGKKSFAQSAEESADDRSILSSTVHVAIDGRYRGYFEVGSRYRDGLPEEIKRLGRHYELVVLTGDTTREEGRLRELFGHNATLIFNKLPHDKRAYVEKLKADNRRVIMLGDGLNDAGALGAADVGIAVTEDTSAFTPGCDGILHAGRLTSLSRFLAASKAVRRVVFASFAISIIYNLVGLSFAATGHLSPLVSAILMPVSSVSVVAFGTTMSWLAVRKEGLA